MYYSCLLNDYRNTPRDETRVVIVQARSTYTHTVRKNNYAHDKEQIHKLESARFTHAKM